MLESWIRPRYERVLVAPAARRLVDVVSPNAVTLLSLAAGVAAAPAIVTGHPLLACGLLLLSGYLDTLDGTLARLSGRTSPFGAMLDVTCDRLVEWAVVLGLYGLDPASRGWPALLMLGSVLVVVTGFLTAGIFIENDTHKSFNYTPGLMERPEAFAFFGVMILFPAAFDWAAGLFTLLVLNTAARRMLEARRALQPEPDRKGGSL